MRVHRLTFAALAIAAGLSLTACQSGDDGTGQSAPSATSRESAPGGGSSANGTDQGAGSDSGGSDQSGGAGTGKGSAGKGSTAGTGSDASGKVDRCHTDELEITAKDDTIDGDPDGTVAVQLKNGGGRDCTISGYAGVDLKTGSGSLSAKRTGAPTDRTVLKSGQSTAFGITYPLNESGGSGVRITGLLVTPPNETKTVTLAWPGGPTLPVTDGAGAPVKVGPIGSAGQGG
ncbi:DUF4232 domain-containing protein [Streptomyces sp. NBC_00659]|uniref:DUF4232 domain-containing protein n=1 Tax=Streptomyces sp. NBC_00659 TaxID=2903669 RepID=UPI002E35E5F4|nr:DUF4232 domain-containing protein [Streptomyces sp. NBC_00659]